MRFILLLTITLLFSNCGEESNESKRYDVLTLLDSGDFSSALNKIGDCETNSFFESKSECYLNRGMAYFGLANYDITSVGEDIYSIYIDKSLDDENRTREIMTLIFNKFKGLNMSLGLKEYKKVLYFYEENQSICTSVNFETLNDYSQQACIAINPVLLLNVINDDKSDNAIVDLEDLIELENSIRGVFPDLTDRELIDILNGDRDSLSTSSQSELEFSLCLISDSNCDGIDKSQVSTFENFNIWKLSNEEYTSLKLTDSFGSITLLENGIYIDHNRTACSKEEYQKYDGECFPKPKDLDSNSTSSLTSTLVDKLNNDSDFTNSLDSILSVGDDTQTSEDVIADICGYSDCKVTEENLIQYFEGL
jgi:hypothetical protein